VVSCFDDSACKFCLSGAIMHAIWKVSGRTNNSEHPEFSYIKIASCIEVPNKANMPDWNDTQENSETVLQLLDETIKRLEQE
jgi:hypothetical protein